MLRTQPQLCLAPFGSMFVRLVLSVMQALASEHMSRFYSRHAHITLACPRPLTKTRTQLRSMRATKSVMLSRPQLVDEGAMLRDKGCEQYDMTYLRSSVAGSATSWEDIKQHA